MRQRERTSYVTFVPDPEREQKMERNYKKRNEYTGEMRGRTNKDTLD